MRLDATRVSRLAGRDHRPTRCAYARHACRVHVLARHRPGLVPVEAKICEAHSAATRDSRVAGLLVGSPPRHRAIEDLVQNHRLTQAAGVG
jgi:hypothetical protein